MGLYAKLPFAVAPGMGINAFFTFTIILTQKVWWQVALGIVFWAGVLFLIISVTPVRETIAKAIPAELRLGTAAGIGIFLTFIGLKNAGLIAADPVTFVKLGNTRRAGAADNRGDRHFGLAANTQERFCFSGRNIFRNADRLGARLGQRLRKAFSAHLTFTQSFSNWIFSAR